jgi:protein required for attachment to host cells
MRIRIVVADQSEARFYDAARRGARLQSVGRVSDPTAHLHDRDLKSDRPGRTFDRAASGPGRRGAVAHHATGGERRPRKIQAQRFARRVVTELKKSSRTKGFDRVVLMAAPSFLGLLRAALPASMRKLVVAEINRDLVHQTVAEVRSHLPEAAFAGEE